jgi:hypothetical protein
MLVRGASAMMATGMMMTGMAFLAGVGLGAAAVGGACLARQAMKRRSEWRDDHHAMPSDTTAATTGLHGDDPMQPGAMPAG